MSRGGLGCWRPSWDAPSSVRALTTLRRGGVSAPPFDALNLAAHVGDDPRAVRENRRRARVALRLPSEPVWLRQCHGRAVVDAATADPRLQADGSFTTQAGVVCAVLTADCVPLFLCDGSGSRVAVLHVGWRGLAAGIVEAGIAALALDSAGLLACLGPGIGPDAFEVGADVRRALIRDAAEAALTRPSARPNHWCVDLYGLIALRLRAAGVDVSPASDDGVCTVAHETDFFSYRRQGRCGRMASLIWITP